MNCLVFLQIAFGHVLLRPVVGNFLHALPAQQLVVSLCQYVMDALGQIVSLLELGNVAVLLMVYHFRDATHTESDAGYAAGHRLHQRIRQVVL